MPFIYIYIYDISSLRVNICGPCNGCYIKRKSVGCSVGELAVDGQRLCLLLEVLLMLPVKIYL